MAYNNESTTLLMTQVTEKLEQVCANNGRGRVLTHPSSKIDDGHSFVAPALPMPALNDTMELAKGVLNLQEIDQKLIELDQMMAKAQVTSPGETEAKQWQELSLLTLQWSRKNLIEQRQACLRRIVDLASEQADMFPPSAATAHPYTMLAEPVAPQTVPQAAPVAPQAVPQAVPAVRPPPGLEAMQAPPGMWVTSEQPSDRERLLSSMTTSEEEADPLAPTNSETPMRKESGVPDLENNGETLRMHLQCLQEEDPKNVLILRKINKLGFESPELLETYFSEYGEVKRVLVAHCRVKPSNRRARSRVRPAGLGFVIMASAADVDAVLCLGEQQLVSNVPIQVQSYQQRGKQDFSSFLEDES